MPSYVVVGASRGLGFQFLRTLSKDPNNVIVGTVRSTADTEAKAKAEKLANVHILPADLTDAASLNRAASEVAKLTGGAVDHLIVNGAYLSPDSAFFRPSGFIGKEDFFADEMVKSYQTNTVGVLFAINAFLPLVKKSSIKKVIVISTGHAATDEIMDADVAEAIPYALSKVAVNMLVAKYAVESRLNGDGVIFLALSPGFVYTMHDGPLEEAPAEIRAVYESLTKQFQKGSPDFKGPITPVESIEAQLKVIEGLTEKDNGAFLSHFGNKTWL